MGSGGHTRTVRRHTPPRGEGLVTVIVEYPTGVDRCTIYPSGLTESERLTRWLSADASTFECLERWR